MIMVRISFGGMAKVSKLLGSNDNSNPNHNVTRYPNTEHNHKLTMTLI